MAETNLGWGAPRIHGELLKLGIEVSERTVSRLMPKRTTAPSQTWRTFLDNHVRDLVSIGFFTVPSARLRVLFVFIVLSHERRRVVHFNVTEHPTSDWTAQQIVEAFPEDQEPRYLIRDRDGTYGQYFQERVQGMGIREVAPLHEVHGKILSRRESLELLLCITTVPISRSTKGCDSRTYGTVLISLTPRTLRFACH
jgi:putative transposase